MVNKDGNASKIKAKQDITSNIHNPKSHDDRLNDEEIESIADKLIDENMEAFSKLAE